MTSLKTYNSIKFKSAVNSMQTETLKLKCILWITEKNLQLNESHKHVHEYVSKVQILKVHAYTCMRVRAVPTDHLNKNLNRVVFV